MYENLLGQDEVRNRLIADIESDRIPPTLLFSGPPASGKLTAALETARIFSCSRGAAWNCACPDCVRHRSLANPDLLLFGSRTYPEEIVVAREYLERHASQAAIFFFIRAVRKLLGRFDPALWAGEETKLAKAQVLVRSIEEKLADFNPSLGQKPSPEYASLAEAIVSDSVNLEALVPEVPGVGMIRAMESWARLAPLGSRRTVILENADRLQESARNAMLKILEEPPETVRFVLITHRRAALMATIASRSHLYPFAARDALATREILSKVFKTGEEAQTLDSYLRSRAPYSPGAAEKQAALLIGRLLLDREGSMPEPEPAYASALKEAVRTEGRSLAGILEDILRDTQGFGQKNKAFSGSYIDFMRAVLFHCSKLISESSGNPGYFSLVERFSKAAKDSCFQHSTLNRSGELLLQTLAASFGEER